MHEFVEGRSLSETPMKIFSISALCIFCLSAYAAPAGSATPTAWSGTALLTTAGHTYTGTYCLTEKLIVFDIDGLTYKGYYASHAEDGGDATSGISAGKWGRAFLFASSAKVLRCQLESGFPTVSGQCQGADGRIFRLTPGAPLKPPTATRLPATN